MKIMKKILCTVLVVVLCLTSAPLGGFVGLELPEWNWKASAVNELAATGQCGDNVYWNYDSATGELVISGTGAMYNYDWWDSPSPFQYTNIKTICIKEGVTTISDLSFYDCNKLTDIFIGDCVEVISKNAFSCCDNLTSITVNESNTVYSSDSRGVLFNKGKTTLLQYPIGNTSTTYTIPSTVTTIGDSAFAYCHSLTSITIPNSVTTISELAFSGCYSLTSITIPDSVIFIGEGAFRNCTNLMRIFVKNPMAEIQRYAFEGTALYNNHSNGVVYVDNIAVGYKGEIPEDLNLVIKDGTVAIADYFFYFDKWNNTHDYNESKKLKSLVLPNSLIKIGKYSFTDCGSLHTLKLGDNLKTVFGFGNVWLQNLYVNNVESLLNIDFSEWGLSTINLFINGELATDLYIPEGAEKITYGTMRVLHSSSVTGIYVPNSVKDIEEYSLNNFVTYCNQNSYAADYCGVYDLPCVYVDAGSEINVIGGNVAYDSDLTWCLDKRTGLLEITGTGELYNFYNEKSAPWYEFRDFITSIVVPEHFSLIGDYSFYGLYRVNKVIIPDNVRIIGEQAFYGCGIYEISLPQTLTTIETKAFFSNQFFNIVIPNSVTTIESYAFGHCINLSYIYIPKNVNSIGDMCFNGNLMSEFDVDENNNFYSSFEGVLYDKNKTKLIQFPVNSNISTFTIPDSVKTIQKYAFYSYEDNRNLNIIIPNSVEYIERNAFENENIINISMGNGIISIGSEAFRGTMIKEIFLPDTVQEMGYGIFKECERLTAVEIPDNITQIGKDMFRNCEKLKSITIPKSVKLISGYAFYVTSLRDIYYKGSEKQWNNIEIENLGNEYYLSNATIHFLGEDDDEPDTPDEPKPDGYKLKLWSDGAYSDSIAVGESIGFDVYLLENGKYLDCERPYAVSFDVQGVFEVSQIKRSTDSMYIKLIAMKPGTTNMTISDNVTGAYVTLKLKANVPVEVLTMDEVNSIATEEYGGITTHFYDYNGLYVNNYFYNKKDDGLYNVRMRVYNEKAHLGAAISYDENGNIYDFKLIEQMHKLPTNLWSGTFDVFDRITYRASWLMGNGIYTDKGFSQDTFVNIDVPENGHLVVTNNINNEIVFFANMNDIALDFLFACEDILFDDIPVEITDDVADIVIREAIAIIGSTALTKLCKDVFKKYATGVTTENVKSIIADLSDALEDVGVDYFEIYYKAILESLDFEMALSIGEDIGLKLAGLGDIKKFLDGCDYINTFIKIYDITCSLLASEIAIYTPPAEEKVRISNGVTVTSEKPLDPKYVLHTYVINQNDDLMTDAVPTIDPLADNYNMYDITLYKSSQAVQPNAKIKVMIPIPAGYDKSRIAVYWYKEDGTLEKMNATVNGSYAIFETDHLSYYVLVEEHVHTYGEDGEICTDCGFDRTEGCGCNCHKTGIAGFFWKIINFFNKIFKLKQECKCGIYHY